MRIVIVMPAYKAAKTIESVFERIPKDFYGRIHRIIVVNDGSTDSTLEVVEKLSRRYDKILCINHEKNKGYGAAQKTGFNKAVELDADISVLLHSDGQYAPELLPEMVKPIEEGRADVVMGSRFLGGGALKGGMPLYKYAGNRILTAIENIAYGMSISEFHTGYMIYSKKALESIKFNNLSDTFHFDGEMVMMAGKKSLRIVEIGIPTRYAEEESHLKPIRYGLDVLSIIIKEKRGEYDF
ncbi:MAG: glycosyltransferase family 2 protein [Candidatus Altiarchaeota archaeon]|nr:glycosyltransferase family 2 protein [Candidatus Altiarchaeota archaeon]